MKWQEADVMSMEGRLFAVALVAVAALTTACLPPPVDPGPTRTAPQVGGCYVFPDDNAWNKRIDTTAVRSDSSTLISHISSPNRTHLHPDFGGNGEYGIPFKVVPSSEPKVRINYTAYGDESDPGPFPIPSNAPVEGGSDQSGDRHVLVVQQGSCHLYELGRAFWNRDHWDADVGVNWDLNSNKLRTKYWTSADAAGLPILPGLVRYDEVQAGVIKHAIRFTAPKTQKGFINPATHYASSSTDPALPPMGLRVRLKKNFDLSGFHGQSLVILQAMKTYGMIVADNGSSWFFQGAADTRWNDDDLGQMKSVPDSAFEAVDTGAIQH
jgi:hypothetical protein